jgi:hypothetical protein
MTLLERFVQYASDFEKTYRDDDWSRLEDYFSEDATYAVENVPFAFEARGRKAVLAAIRRSVDGFDRKLERRVEVVGAPSEEGDRVVVAWRGHYEKEGAPPLAFGAQEIAVYENGRIRELRDVYDDDATATFERWMREHGAGLDVSYL